MSLHYDGKPITTQVESANNIFTFNQDVTLKLNTQNSTDLEISAYLSTGKGGSILAGMIVFNIDVLNNKTGNKIIVPLQKCIDTAAVVQVKINHSWIPQDNNVGNNKNMVKSTTGGLFIRSGSPQNNKGKIRTQNDHV